MINDDRDELRRDLANLAEARKIASHLDLDLKLDFYLISHDELRLTVDGEEEQVLSFLSRCREGDLRIKAVREDDASSFRLV